METLKGTALAPDYIGDVEITLTLGVFGRLVPGNADTHDSPGQDLHHDIRAIYLGTIDVSAQLDDEQQDEIQGQLREAEKQDDGRDDE